MDKVQFCQIVSIEEIGIEDVWDIEVEEDHSYHAHGFINHNSSSDPNLTNIPKRSQLGKKMRGMFQHDYGHAGTLAADYSQIEYRMLVHHAVGPGSEEVRLQYNTDPKTDYHKMTQALVKEIGGVFIPRNADEMAESGMNITIKEINFGLCLAEGTLVLTNYGLVKIEDIKWFHLLWDGVEWVTHEGLLYKGIQGVMEYSGLEATRFHSVFLENETRTYFAGAWCNGEKIVVSGNGEAPIEINYPFRVIDKDLKVTHSPICRPSPVYDILNAGPRHRFTANNLLVSNCYGMMEGKLGRQAGLDKPTTAKVFAAYHSAAPYVKATMEHIQQEVYDYGYITTISGRRTRFNTWECKDRNYNEEYKTYSIEQAINLYGSNIQRAYAYRGVNYKLQGGAADIIKRAMWKCWKDGIYDVIGVPRLTVHDENMHSVIDWGNEQRDAYSAMIWTMENSTKLLIPVRFDAKTGNNWGEC